MLFKNKTLFNCLFFILIVAGYSGTVNADSDLNGNPLPIVGDILGKAPNSDSPQLPRNFRTVKHHYQNLPPHLPRDGLEDLPVAGTAQFTKSQLREMIEFIGQKTVIIDLREETHLHLKDINGEEVPVAAFAPYNLANVGKTADEIEEDHLYYKAYLLEKQNLPLYYAKGGNIITSKTPPVVNVGNVYTEREIVEQLASESSYQVSYLLIPVTDHKSPTAEVIDEFITLLKVMNVEEPDTVLLFHCLAGRGRTGLFMVLADIFINAKKHNLLLEDILKRHAEAGSPDYTRSDEGHNENSQERLDLIQKIYDYAMAEDGHVAGTPYSEWSIRADNSKLNVPALTNSEGPKN